MGAHEAITQRVRSSSTSEKEHEMKILDSLKALWKRPPAGWHEERVSIHTPIDNPVVTILDDGAVIVDMEGEEWTLRRDGRMVYLSGQDGAVQAQFHREAFKVFVKNI